MSKNEKRDRRGSLGYQKKSAEEVDEIVNRLSTPRKPNEPKDPERHTKIEREMATADIDEMVTRLCSASRRRERRASAYDQGGVFLSYSCTGWDRPGSGGKFMA